MNYKNIIRTGRNWVSFLYKGIYFIYIIPFGEQQPWMSEIPQLERFNKKQVPRNDQFPFIMCFKKIFFQAHWRVPPTTGVVELWQKLFCNEHQRKWVVFLEKWMNIFTGDLYYMYAILQGIGSFSCIRVIIYYIHNSLWGAATLDVWSS